MTDYQPSQENVDKVSAYFVSKVKTTGSRRFSETIADIARNSDVALATAHRVIKQLVAEKKITAIRHDSRRIANEYIYHDDIVGFLLEKDKDQQISYLQDLVQQLVSENEDLRQQIRKSTFK
ncbi:hypothetical protein BSK48_05245 [Paenibacillus odorifer]|uniref:hypothetical protein n=1 Tax=Paenibacillus odorifer TaxID=189426 RepID=UPI00096F8AF8|nr:hypothetical protein [Paenibacillus odorifer]OMD73276.1 hypothetical protein BSK48_05245 [Paenibacillus odorifer]